MGSLTTQPQKQENGLATQATDRARCNQRQPSSVQENHARAVPCPKVEGPTLCAVAADEEVKWELRETQSMGSIPVERVCEKDPAQECAHVAMALGAHSAQRSAGQCENVPDSKTASQIKEDDTAECSGPCNPQDEEGIRLGDIIAEDRCSSPHELQQPTAGIAERIDSLLRRQQ